MIEIRKYFWGLNEAAIKETYKILKNPDDPKYVQRIFAILSRTDKVKEVFKIIPKEQFVSTWPMIRKYWLKIGQYEEFFSWWETVYESLLGKRLPKKEYSKTLSAIGSMIKTERIKKGWTQADFAKRVGVDQPYISRIESGKQIEIETLLKICKVLGIKSIPVDL